MSRLLQRSITAVQKRANGAYKDEAHLKHIRSLPCAACHRRPSQAAHVRFNDHVAGKAQALGAKPDDCWTVPLCASCHLDAPDAQHRVGEAVFWARVGIDPIRLAAALHQSPREAGVRLVHEQDGGVAVLAEVVIEAERLFPS